MKIKSKQFSNQIEALRRRLERWRQQREPRERIPETLWRAMAQLARTHGVSRVSHELGIDYHGLKRRAEAGRRTDQVPQPKAATFLEFKVPGAIESCAWAAEFENRSGDKLRLRLAQSGWADILKLIQAFLKGCA